MSRLGRVWRKYDYVVYITIAICVFVSSWRVIQTNGELPQNPGSSTIRDIVTEDVVTTGDGGTRVVEKADVKRDVEAVSTVQRTDAKRDVEAVSTVEKKPATNAQGHAVKSTGRVVDEPKKNVQGDKPGKKDDDEEEEQPTTPMPLPVPVPAKDRPNSTRQLMSEPIMPKYDYKVVDNDLSKINRMNYVKGMGYVFIYNNRSMVENEFNKAAEEKVILIYNSWRQSRTFGFGTGTNIFARYWCTRNKCRTTLDLKEHKIADMVIFSAENLDYTKKVVIPPRAHPSQIYVFWNYDSPLHETNDKLQQFGTTFNMTVSYRTDSSIPYLLYQTRARSRRISRSIPHIALLRHKRTGKVAWYLPKCHESGSLSMEYAEELGKHVNVDLYGPCGKMKNCSHDDRNHCVNYIAEGYKFVLAFEKSLCKDYISENVYRALQANILPIVMGGGHYERYLPPNSYINVRDFESPRDLARYIVYLNENDKEYMKYMEWKADWILWRSHSKVVFCQLCEVLHGKGSEKVRSDLDIHQWWQEQAQCVQPKYLVQASHLVKA